MARTPMFPVSKVAEALRQAKGLRSLAAKMLGCAPNTIKGYIDRHPSLQDLEREVTEATIDMVEAELLKNIRAGKEASIFFYLKCKAKHRGYVERQEITGADGGPVEGLLRLSPEERQAQIDALTARIETSKARVNGNGRGSGETAG